MTVAEESDPFNLPTSHQEHWLQQLRYSEALRAHAINELAKYATIPVEVIVVGVENQAGFDGVSEGQTWD